MCNNEKTIKYLYKVSVQLDNLTKFYEKNIKLSFLLILYHLSFYYYRFY
jgi:hypothetical protein